MKFDQFLASLSLSIFLLNTPHAFADGEKEFTQDLELRNCATEGANAQIFWVNGDLQRFELSSAASYSYRTVLLEFSTSTTGLAKITQTYRDKSYLKIEVNFAVKDAKILATGMASMDHGETADDALTLSGDVLSFAVKNYGVSPLVYECGD